MKPRSKAVRKLEDTVSKSEVHGILNDELTSYVRHHKVAKRSLRFLMLPGRTGTFETGLMKGPLEKYVLDIIGLESVWNNLQAVKKVFANLRDEHPGVNLRAFSSTDYAFWEPNSNGGAEARYSRCQARPGEGYDMIWLDWMGQWGLGSRLSITSMCNQIQLFQRAWEAGRPGLLYLTVMACREKSRDRQIFRRCMQPFGLESNRETDGKHDLRIKGISAYLNYHMVPHNMHCLPMIKRVYRECGDVTHATMMLLGFQVCPGALRNDDLHVAHFNLNNREQ